MFKILYSIIPFLVSLYCFCPSADGWCLCAFVANLVLAHKKSPLAFKQRGWKRKGSEPSYLFFSFKTKGVSSFDSFNEFWQYILVVPNDAKVGIIKNASLRILINRNYFS